MRLLSLVPSVDSSQKSSTSECKAYRNVKFLLLWRRGVLHTRIQVVVPSTSRMFLR